MTFGEEENPGRCLERTQEIARTGIVTHPCNWAKHVQLAPDRSPLLGTVAFYLAIATVDFLHCVCHKDRPFLLALQFLQLGVPLQPNVITAERNRDTEGTGEVCSENQALLASLRAMSPSSPISFQ